jgi:putative ABC transport system ATP-binding protein
MELRTENLRKVFTTDVVETHALNGVSIDIHDGEFVAIMGPSGCGKSTLLNILGMLDTPTEGTYMLDGREVSTLKEDERTAYRRGKIGFVFQSFNLIEELNVAENVGLPLGYLGIKGEKRRKLVAETLERMGISHRATHHPNQLSGGQQQRVAIARAVVCKPGLVLADEPTGNLDSHTRDEIQSLFFELRERTGQTFIIVTHDEKLAEQSDRKIVMNDGSIL